MLGDLASLCYTSASWKGKSCFLLISSSEGQKRHLGLELILGR